MRRYLIAAFAGAVFLLTLQALVNHTQIADVAVTPLLSDDTSGGADVIVVLGGGVTEACTLNIHSERRVLLAARLYRERRAPLVLMTGGATSASSCSVASVMSEMAREIGIPAEHVLLEERSLGTWENAAMSVPILRAAGASRVLLVTDRLHMRRAELCFARLGLQIERASVPLYRAHEDNVEMLNAAVHEVIGVLYYRVRGWIG